MTHCADGQTHRPPLRTLIFAVAALPGCKDAKWFVDRIFEPEANCSWRSFERVVSQTPRQGETFQIGAMGAAWLRSDRRTFVDGQAFSCEDDQVCAQLDALAAQPEQRFRMTMRHADTPGELVLPGIASDSAK